jgi:hypothetical protein
MIKRFLLFVGLALSTACAPSHTVWYKEGAEPEELRMAQRECSRESQGYGFVFEGSRSGDDLAGGERRAGSTGGGVYRECMERKGWRRYRDQARP